MTDIAAAIGIEQLKKLPGFIEKRQENARYFDEKLKDVETPYVLDNAKHAYHQYTIKCGNRERVIKNLKKNEIGFGIYYPKPLHQYPHLKQYGHDDLKISESLSEEVLSLPVHPVLEKQDLEKIVKVIKGSSLHSQK
jgi:perosamine synthetase